MDNEAYSFGMVHDGIGDALRILDGCRHRSGFRSTRNRVCQSCLLKARTLLEEVHKGSRPDPLNEEHGPHVAGIAYLKGNE